MLFYLLSIYHNVLSDQESANYWGKLRELKLSFSHKAVISSKSKLCVSSKYFFKKLANKELRICSINIKLKQILLIYI